MGRKPDPKKKEAKAAAKKKNGYPDKGSVAVPVLGIMAGRFEDRSLGA